MRRPYNICFKRQTGRLAQLGERCVRNAEVRGSIPLPSTTSHPATGFSLLPAVPVPRITAAELQTALNAVVETDRPVVIDARLKYPFEHSTLTIAGALRHGHEGAALPRDRQIVVYDSDPHELASSAVAAALIRDGYRAVALAGGIAAWLAASGAVTPKDAPKPAAPAGSVKA